jgi:hypothetical protein
MNNTVFGYRFSVKKTRIISKLKLKFVASETELGINAWQRQFFPKLLLGLADSLSSSY